MKLYAIRKYCCAKWYLTCILCTSIATLLSAQQVFDKQKLHDIHIYTQRSDWYTVLKDYYNATEDGAPNRFLSTIVIIDGDTLKQTGFRMKGRYSNFGFPGDKKPFRLDFNEYVSGQHYQGLKKLNLHNLAADPSFMREYMAYDLFEYLGVPAPRASFTKLYINDVYWGCYNIVEEPDKVFLENRFGNKNGNLFECIDDTELTFRDFNPESYPELELKTGGYPDNWEKFLTWVQLFNTYQGYDFQQKFSNEFDSDGWLKILAVDVLLNNWDSYMDNGRNFFIYDDIEKGKLTWIPWDYNLSFWNRDNHVVPFDGSADDGYKPLIARLKDTPYLRDKYLTNFCHLLEYEFRTYPFEERTLVAYNLIKDAVETDTKKFYSNEAFHANRTEPVTVNMLRSNKPTDILMPGLTQLYSIRRKSITNMLFNEGYNCSDMKYESSTLHATLFPNPALNEVTIYFEETESKIVDVAMYDYMGNKVYNETTEAVNGSVKVNTSILEQGVYVASAVSNGKRTSIRFLKQ